MNKFDLDKQRNQRSNCQHSLDHRESKRIPEKYLLLLHWLLKSLWLCRSQQTRKFLKRREYQPTLPDSWEIGIWIKKQQLEPYTEQVTGSKLRKVYDKAACCHPVYLSYMQSISCEMLGWMNYNLVSRLPRNVGNHRYADTTLMAESEEELKSLLIRVKKKSEKADLKFSIQKLRSCHHVPLLHGKWMGKK